MGSFVPSFDGEAFDDDAGPRGDDEALVSAPAGPARKSCRTPSPADTSQLSRCLTTTTVPSSRSSRTCSTPQGHANTGDHGNASLNLTMSFVL